MKFWNKLKIKWNIETDKRMAWIFVIFAITGSTTVIVRKYLYGLLGINIENAFLSGVVKIVAIYIVYQILLFVVGTLMGEGKFVRWFLTKMNSRFIGKKVS
ncbi:MAG: xanthosine utilization system XapX-like protein [Flavobacteriales bacterium]|jgi:xanthosine utilization system XapX-like protein